MAVNFYLTWQIFWVFFKISLMSIGGVFGMMPELERLIVFEHHWMSSEQFLQAYVIGQFVPGPTMAFCPIIGYMVNGWIGFVAGFIGIYAAPTMMIVIAYRFYSQVKSLTWIKKIELSIRPVVIGLLSASTIRLWIIQTHFQNHQVALSLLTLALMLITIWIYYKTKWDLLILILGFGFSWSSVVYFLSF
jgi:chromate transporter